MEMDIADIGSLPALKRLATSFIRFISRSILRFIHDKCIQRASALGYASLLAIVPLVVLGFSVFTSFQAFDNIAIHIRSALLEYLLPTSQQVVQEYLAGVTEKAGTLSVFGIIGLLLASTALLNTMEEAFNGIWRIKRKRSLLSKFITFWSLLTLSPILIGASVTITSYFAALPIIRDVTETATFIQEVPFLLPWLISSSAMTALYMVLPNTRVPLRYAIVGGLIAGGLFELTKLGFTFYVTELASFEKIYGVLGTLPVFLIWLYLIWVVVLIGAEVTYCLQNPEQSQRHGEWLNRAGVRNFFCHLILLRAAQAIQRSQVLQRQDLIDETELPENIIQEWLELLRKQKLLKRVGDDDSNSAWVLGDDASSMHLQTIHAAVHPHHIEVPEAWQNTPTGRILDGLYAHLHQEQSDCLSSVNLQTLLDKESATHNKKG